MSDYASARLFGRAGHPLSAVSRRLGSSAEVTAGWERGREERAEWDSHLFAQETHCAPESVGTVSCDARQFEQ